MASRTSSIKFFVKAFDTPSGILPLFVKNTQLNSNNTLPLYVQNNAASSNNSGLFSTLNLFVLAGMTPISGGITLFTNGDGKYWDSIPLYVASGVPYKTGSITLFVNGVYASTDSSLPFYVSNSGAYTNIPLVTLGGGFNPDPFFVGTSGAQGAYGSITLFVARNTESVVGSIPFVLPSPASGFNSNIPFYVSSSNSGTNDSLNLVIPVVYDIKTEYLSLYSHGF